MDYLSCAVQDVTSCFSWASSKSPELCRSMYTVQCGVFSQQLVLSVWGSMTDHPLHTLYCLGWTVRMKRAILKARRRDGRTSPDRDRVAWIHTVDVHIPPDTLSSHVQWSLNKWKSCRAKSESQTPFWLFKQRYGDSVGSPAVPQTPHLVFTRLVRGLSGHDQILLWYRSTRSNSWLHRRRAQQQVR